MIHHHSTTPGPQAAARFPWGLRRRSHRPTGGKAWWKRSSWGYPNKRWVISSPFWGLFMMGISIHGKIPPLMISSPIFGRFFNIAGWVLINGQSDHPTIDGWLETTCLKHQRFHLRVLKSHPKSVESGVPTCFYTHQKGRVILFIYQVGYVPSMNQTWQSHFPLL